MDAVAYGAPHADEAENRRLLARLAEASSTWVSRPETDEMGVLYTRPTEQYWFVNNAALALLAAVKEGGGGFEDVAAKYCTVQLRAFASRLGLSQPESEPAPGEVDSTTPWAWSTDEQIAPERCSTFGMPL